MLGSERITHRPPHARVKPSLSRTLELNTLFADLNGCRIRPRCRCERRGNAATGCAPLLAAGALEEAHALLRTLGSTRRRVVTHQLRTASSGCWKSPCAGRQARVSFSTSRPPACPRRERELLETIELLPRR
jgi:hypothetical protein